MDEATGTVGRGSGDPSTPEPGSHMYSEYRKHLEFLRLIDDNNVLIDTDLAAEFIKLAMGGLEQGEVSDSQYHRIKRELQESIRDSNAVLRELKDTPPSSEFERTRELYKKYIRKVEIVNSELEMFIEDVESGSGSERLDELADNLDSLQELGPKLSRSMGDDLEEINTFIDDFNH